MTDTTPLDMAHAAMQAAADDDGLRLQFYDRLADSELLLMLRAEVQGDVVEPETFETSNGLFVLAFDREDRLTRFTGAPSPYLALSGRALAAMLAGQGIGLGLNLRDDGAGILIPAGAVDWLVDTLANAPDEVVSDLAEVTAPAGLPERLLTALDSKLATAAGMAECAYLAGTRTREGGVGHVLAIIGAPDQAQVALAGAVTEALTFSGIEAGTLDIGFFAASDPLVDRLAAVGLRFDIPQPASRGQPEVPGSDPDKPPILR